MAQVDFVNYFSILFWFFIFIVIYYLLNYSVLFPSIYSILTVRYNMYKLLITRLKSQIGSYIKNYTYSINSNVYIVFSFFLKKWTYLNII